MLDSAEQIEARPRPPEQRGPARKIAAILGWRARAARRRAHTLAARAQSRALKLHITGDVPRPRPHGRYAFVHERGRDFCRRDLVVDPVFMLDSSRALGEGRRHRRAEDAYFAGRPHDDDELRDAAAEDEQRRAQVGPARRGDPQQPRLGHDIRAGLLSTPPTPSSARSTQIVCRLLVRHYAKLIAYLRGWTDPERQQPVGDTAATNRATPTQSPTRSSAGPRRPRPAPSIAQLTARWQPRSSSTPQA